MSYSFDYSSNRLCQGSKKWQLMAEDWPEASLEELRQITPLSVADGEFLAPKYISEALFDLINNYPLGYSSPRKSYWQACIDWQKKHHDWTPKQEWIVTTPGVVPAIHMSILALTQPGDKIIIQEPVYGPFRHAVESLGRVVLNNQLIHKDNRYSMNFEELEKLASDDGVSMLILCSPHNPVGRVWSQDELCRLGQICQERNISIVSDEIHGDVISAGFDFCSMGKLVELQKLKAKGLVICSSPSKTFNLAGCQVSNIFIPDEETRSSFKEALDHAHMDSINCFGLWACEAAYRGEQDWLQETQKLYAQNEKIVEELLVEGLGLSMSPREGTYLSWVDFSSWKMSPEEREDYLKHECKVYLSPGRSFGDAGQDFERINLACSPQILHQTLSRIKGVSA